MAPVLSTSGTKKTTPNAVSIQNHIQSTKEVTSHVPTLQSVQTHVAKTKLSTEEPKLSTKPRGIQLTKGVKEGQGRYQGTCANSNNKTGILIT